jgi:hypothetical protein
VTRNAAVHLKPPDCGRGHPLRLAALVCSCALLRTAVVNGVTATQARVHRIPRRNHSAEERSSADPIGASLFGATKKERNHV